MRSSLALLVLLAVLLGSFPEAGATPTGKSRANCLYWGWTSGIRNESVTWDTNPMNVLWLWTNTYHYYKGSFRHSVASYWHIANLVRVGDDEPYDITRPWAVFGRHWYWTQATQTRELPSTDTTACL